VKTCFAVAVTVLTFLLAACLAPKRAAAQPGSAACDAACLSAVMEAFLKDVTSGRADSVPVVLDAEIRENGRPVAIAATTWASVKSARSVLTFADAVTGNVVSRAGVELSDGKPGYISTRLKVVGGRRIADVELSVDTSPRVVGSYVSKLDPQLNAVLPPEQRLSRVELEALGRRYFNSLSSHVAVRSDFDDRCNRFHSGQQVTNVARNTVEGGPPRTCAGSLEGSVPWGPATEHRFPVIDPERGIVFGITLLHYQERPGQPRMYVSEVFKVVGGKIVAIDNIGLMLEGVTHLGFAH
jgi:hypothetical protein